jgi:hypothetical protein
MSTMSLVKNPKLYEAVLDAAMHLVKNGYAPIRILPVNSYLYRASPDRYYMHRVDKVNRSIPRSVAAEIIEVRDFGAGENRFSGSSPRHAFYSNGGCYFFVNQGAGLAEMMYYAEKDGLRMDRETGRVSIPHMMGNKYIFQVKVTQSLQVADISLYGQNAGGAREFLRRIGQFNLLKSGSGASTSVERLFDGVRLEDEVVNQNGDYSVTRALGQAFAQFPQFFAGVIAQTARETEREGESGENICLFGSATRGIKGLEVVRLYSFFGNGVERYIVA